MISDGELLALFNSPTRVLKAEQVVRKAGLSCRLIPAPREVAEGCALALRFAAAERTTIISVLDRQDLLPRRLYLKTGGIFQSIAVIHEP